MTFRGTYDHSLDAKYRLTIPSRFRAALADGVVLAVSPEIVEASAPRAVAVWTPAEYDEYSRSVLQGLNPATPKARELKRFLHSTSFETELDSANRVMIPEFLRTYAGLSKEVTVLGSGEYLEVLDRGAYAHGLQSSLDRLPDLLASLGDTA